MTETHDSSQNPPERLSAAQAVAAGVDFAELDVSSAGLFWNEYRPEDGASRIWHWYANSKRCLTPKASAYAAGCMSMAVVHSASPTTP